MTAQSKGRVLVDDDSFRFAMRKALRRLGFDADEAGGNITRAAASLGIDRRTLQRKLRGYGIMADE